MADPTALRLGDDDAMNGVERTADPVAVWAAAIARSPLAMLIVGGSQRVVRASNYALGNLLGVPGERLDGRRLPEVLPGPVADAAVSIVDRVRHMTRAERGVEVEVVVDGGPTRAWKLAAWPILDLDDRLDGVCVQAADVTAEVAARRKERELGEQVREANDRLLQAGIREQELADLARRHAEEVD
ncbi:MAG: PAS domain-containing protein, partial [Gemmatimonadota bacterium]